MTLAPLIDAVQWHWVFWGALAAAGCLGLLAMVSPPAFARVAVYGKTWIDVDQTLRKLDRTIDIDGHVLRHTRLFGAIVLGAVLAAACVLLL